MRFRLVIAGLLLSMLLQAVSLGGHWAGHGNPVDALHAVLHWSGVLHHHDHEVTGSEQAQATQQLALDEEGFEAFAEELAQVTLHAGEDYHRDLSLDSRHHLSIDACLSAAAIIPSLPVSPRLTVEACPPAFVPESERTDPFLDGPRRPPRSLA